MPEIITKYPDVVLRLFKDVNIKCGVGKPQNILTTCPKDQFCALPRGEVCVYGIQDIHKMTQVTALDIFQVSAIAIPILALLIMVFLLGILTGTKIRS